jgi:peptidoglycan/LPS O-acetylase OafA/YrhL
MMAACIIYAWFHLLPVDMEDFLKGIGAISVFGSNILFWQQSGYFDKAAELKPLLHTWSLAVEEQYYLLFPVFLIATWRLGSRMVMLCMFVVFVMSLALSEWAVHSKPVAAYYLLPTRAWELVMGSMLALLPRPNPDTRHRALLEAGAIIGLALISIPVFTYSKNTVFPGLAAIPPTLGAALIIYCAFEKSFVGRVLSSSILVGIGLISYSTYLWHQPIFAFWRSKFETPDGAPIFIALSAASLLAGYLSWKYIEAPFRDKDNFSRKTVFILWGTASLAFLLFALGGIRGGYENRLPKNLRGDIGHYEFHKYLSEGFIDCTPPNLRLQAPDWEGFLRCKQSTDGIPDHIILGDSHAEHLFPGMANQEKFKSIGYYIQSSKPYINNPEFKEIFNTLKSTRKHQTVFLTMHYVGRIGEHDEEFPVHFSSTIDWLLKNGKSVVLVGDVPKFDADPAYCMHGLTNRNSKDPCSIPRETSNLQRKTYESSLQAMSEKFGIQYIAVDDIFCGDKECSMTDGQHIFYRDPNHLNLPGSLKVGALIAQRFQSPTR